jgi:hypothetical protein
MRRLASFFLMFFFVSAFLSAENGQIKNSRISVSGGIYFMQNDVFKQVYGDSAWIFCGEYSYRLPFLLRKHLEIGVEYRFLYDKGKLTVTKESVDLTISDFTLSLRYLFDLNKIILFLGPGVDYRSYKEKYPSPFPVNSVEGSVFGFSFLGGCYFDLFSSFGFKLCAQYSYAKPEEGDGKADIGGIGIKAGLVYQFDF